MFPGSITLPGLGWEVQGYGLLLALGLLAGWWVMLRLGARDRLPPGPLGTAYVLGVGLGLVAARVGWILQQPGDAGSGAELFALPGDELAPFTGMVMAAIVGGLHLMRRRVPVVAGYDVAAPAFAVGAIFERLGALWAGTGFGDYAPELPWAVRFPEGSPPYLHHQQDLGGLLPAGAEQSLPVHPTQIYGLLLAGLTLAAALWLRKHRRYSGQVFLGTFIVYLVGRAFIEDWFRADAQGAVLGPFNAGQVGSAVIVIALAVVMQARAKLAQQRPEAYRPWEGGRWSPKAPKPAGPVLKTEASAAGKPTGAHASAASSGARRGASGKGKRKGKGGKHKRRKKR